MSITPIKSEFTPAFAKSIENLSSGSNSDLHQSSGTNLYVTFTGASTGSIDLVSTELPDDLWQRMEWDHLEVYFDVEAVFKEQQGDLLAFDLVKKGGFASFRGKGTQFNYGATSIYNFDRTQNIEIDQQEGILHYSLTEKEITFLQFSLPPSASYPYAEQVIFTGGKIQVKLRLPLNEGWWFTGDHSYFPIPEPAFVFGGQFPVAGFSYSPSEPEPGDSITFDASISTDPDGGNPFYLAALWDFGDGRSGSGRIATHSYKSPGEYIACLTIIDSNNLRDRTCRTIRVVQGLQAPVALFSYMPENPTIDDSITFDASESSDPDGDIVAYSWDFGNGNTASGRIVKVKYEEAANYTVKLTVRDNSGLEDETSRIINFTGDRVVLSGSLYNTRFEKDGRLIAPQPLIDAGVKLYEDNNLLDSVRTSGAGAFLFDQLNHDQKYDLRITASGQLDKSDDPVTVHKTVVDILPTLVFKDSLPLELTLQKRNLLHELQHRVIHPDLPGIVGGIPLINSYDESRIVSLLDDWSEHTELDEIRRTQAIARLLIAEQIYDTLYDYAAFTSHMLSKGIYSTTTAALGYLNYFGILNNSLVLSTTEDLARFLLDYFSPTLEKMIYKLFITSYANWALSSLPADFGIRISEGIHFVEESSFRINPRDLINHILEEGFEKGIVAGVDNVILSYYYIPATQGYVNISAQDAETVPVATDLALPVNASQDLIQYYWDKTKYAVAMADTLYVFGKIGEQISDRLNILPPVLPAMALMSAISVSFRNISIANYSASAKISGGWLNQIATNGVPAGTERAFLTGIKKNSQTNGLYNSGLLKPHTNTTYPAEKLKTGEQWLANGNQEYLEILDELVSHVVNGRRTEAIEAIPDLFNSENTLSETQSVALGPVFATAENAHREVENYGLQYQKLNETITQSISERFHFYTQMMTWLLDESYATDSLVMQAERTRVSLNDVEQVLDETTDLITHIQAPPFVLVSESSIDGESAKPGVDFKLESTIKNLGPLSADSVELELLPDSITSIKSEGKITLSDLAPGESRDVSWTLRVDDTTQHLGSYLIKVNVTNGKGLSSNGIYSIKTARESTGKYPRYFEPSGLELEQNYPNPFSNYTSIKYHLPAKTRVILEIVDMNGKEVKLLTNEIQHTGIYQVEWDGTSSIGSKLPNGVYFVRLITDSEVLSRRMVILE